MSQAADTVAPEVVTAVPAMFPKCEVEAVLREELLDAAATAATLQGVELEGTPEQIAREPFQVDSLVAIAVLTAVEPMLGSELPQKVVRAGGYSSVDEAVKVLLPAIETYWKKLRGDAS